MLQQEVKTICMRGTMEQYNEVLPILLELGYRPLPTVFDDGDYLGINPYGMRVCGAITPSAANSPSGSKLTIDQWDENLFLKLAGLSKRELGGFGEWWYCIEDSDSAGQFRAGNVYMQIRPDITSSHSLFDDEEQENGFSGHNLRHFRKATILELAASEGVELNLASEKGCTALEELEKSYEILRQQFELFEQSLQSFKTKASASGCTCSGNLKERKN